MKRIIPKEEYCIGCHLCEVYCALEHSKSKKIWKAFRESPKPVARLHIEERGYLAISLSCRHCEDPPCVKACMTGAMYKTSSGLVLHEREKCVGCWMCIMVCPYGAVKKGEEEKIIFKCDFCLDRETPACVEGCPQEALVLEEVD